MNKRVVTIRWIGRVGLLGLALALTLSGCSVPQLHPKPKPVAKKSVQVAPEFRHFSFLRRAAWLNHQLVVLRHTHTAQRLVVFQGDSGLEGLYQQGLSVFNLNLLMPLLQANSRFEGAGLKALSVTALGETRLSKGKDTQLVYTRYRVSILKQGKPKPYEAWLGSLIHQGKAQAVVFTFNEAGYVSPEAFGDLLKDWTASRAI